jgi:hypothetical protein
VDRTGRQFDATRQPSCTETVVGEREILRQRKRAISLPSGGEHDRMPAFHEQLEDAVEVTRLGDIIEKEQDAHAVR